MIFPRGVQKGYYGFQKGRPGFRTMESKIGAHLQNTELSLVLSMVGQNNECPVLLTTLIYMQSNTLALEYISSPDPIIWAVNVHFVSLNSHRIPHSDLKNQSLKLFFFHWIGFTQLMPYFEILLKTKTFSKKKYFKV